MARIATVFPFSASACKSRAVIFLICSYHLDRCCGEVSGLSGIRRTFVGASNGQLGRDFLEPPGGTVVDEAAHLILVKDKGVGLNAGHGLTNILF